MKKQNETKTAAKVEESVAKQKRIKKEHLFFLYVPERGFICAGDGMPTVGGSDPIHFSLRSKAKYAAEFFKTLKIADEIQLFAKVG